ncbi:DUF481 domain-containing protein [Vreelandella utahensis]|uniref:DUF481 domain-containing protein n=1 Tax=Vreelandella halophila TaxID=86177 RepID=UPI0015C3A2F5|nr:DUF481 domain-containing protein [Halomonas utahensis]
MLQVQRSLLVTGIAVALAAPAVAQESDEWSGSVELGLVETSGNTEETTVSGEADVTRDWNDWRQNVLLQSRYAEQGGERTAERYSASTQLDYKFNPNDFVFVRGRYSNDDFSGYQFQASTSAGYGRRLWSEGDSHFDLSSGLGYRYSKFDEREPGEGDEREGAIGRLAGDFRYQLSETAHFRQEAETEVSLDDGEAMSRSVTSLQANVNSSLALKLSYTVEHDSNPPEDTERTDTITAVTLLYGF